MPPHDFVSLGCRFLKPAAFVILVISLSASGAVTAEMLRLYMLGLPALLAGLWAGFKLYGKLDDAAFRKLVLLLLFAAGVALIAAQVGVSGSLIARLRAT
jgi:hypothetical protein